MDFENYIAFTEKLIPALVGFAGAWAGSRWGVTKFKREKYWEAKVRAYETVLSHFEQIAFWGRCSRAQAYGSVTIGDNNLKQEVFSDAMRSLAQLEATAFVYFDAKFRELINDSRLKIECVYICNVEDLRGGEEQANYYAYADIQGEVGDLANRALGLLNEQAYQDIGAGRQSKTKHWDALKVKCGKSWMEFRKNIQ